MRLLVFQLLLLVSSSFSILLIEDELRLQRHLDRIHYSRYVVPLRNKSVTDLTIKFGFSPVSLVELDGAKQSVKVMGFLSLKWNDELLVWSDKEFPVAFASRPHETTWSPEIYLFNGMSEESVLVPQVPISLYHVNANVTQAYLMYKQTFEVNCQMNMSDFPYDVQTCYIILAVNADSDSRLKILLDNPNRNYLAAYFNHSEWSLVNFTSYPHDLQLKMMKSMPHAVLKTFVVKMQFQRLGLYYTRNIVIPVTVLTILQVLIFLIPIESNEKITFGITLLLAFTIYMLLFEKLIPKSPIVPVIFTFITSSMILSAVSVFLSGCVLMMYYTPEDAKMPRIMRWLLIDWGARILLVRNFGTRKQRMRHQRQQQQQQDANEAEEMRVWQVNTQGANGDSDFDKNYDQRVNNRFRRQMYYRHQWRLAALVMERILAIVSCCCVTVFITSYYAA